MAGRILRVFPRRTTMTPTDDDAFVGDPPLWRPAPEFIDEVHVSVTFTWDIERGKQLARAWSAIYGPGFVRIGGPVFSDKGGEFVPGRYLRPGATITTRGCPRQCAFCFVPQREGRLRELGTIQPGNNICDNNLLAASRSHWNRVAEMLKTQHGIEFSGGLDAELLQDFHFEWFAANRGRIKQLFLALDRHSQRERVRYVSRVLNGAGFTRRQLRCYVLVGFPGDTVGAAEARLEEAWEAGTLPFAMRWRGEDGRRRIEAEWYPLCSKWMRPAAMFHAHGIQSVDSTASYVEFADEDRDRVILGMGKRGRKL